MQVGIGVHLYAATAGMGRRYFADNDGELLLVPQAGRLDLHTECGRLLVEPGEIAVVPRGMKFGIQLPDGTARGYVCENYGSALRLPERGPVGSDGFANTRDFQTPVACYVDDDEACELVCKFHGQLHRAQIDHCPLDVVAWTGNAVPYKYALARFCALNSVTFDHPDPSIFTVLTAPSANPGIANVDFVIFPPRWSVAEHTFRPPWYHRNVMSEFMGLIRGQYDARARGFAPGGMSLHNAFVPHGPDAAAFARASAAALAPEKLDQGLAFMFETRYALHVSDWALTTPALQQDYRRCWDGLARRFARD
jgi:homogentisate 1,2-dioxygenase